LKADEGGEAVQRAPDTAVNESGRSPVRAAIGPRFGERRR
jgi:hypothetical protein